MPSFKIDVCKKSVKKQKIAILALLREGLYWCAKDLIFFCTFSFFFIFPIDNLGLNLQVTYSPLFTCANNGSVKYAVNHPSTAHVIVKVDKKLVK